MAQSRKDVFKPPAMAFDGPSAFKKCAVGLAAHATGKAEGVAGYSFSWGRRSG
jgi:hypothetical protein